MYAISYFKHEADAQAAALAGCNAIFESNGGPVITVNKGAASKWWTVCVDEYVGALSQRAIAVIKRYAAKIEIEGPGDAHCGSVGGAWSDPRDYLPVRRNR